MRPAASAQSSLTLGLGTQRHTVSTGGVSRGQRGVRVLTAFDGFDEGPDGPPEFDGFDGF